ncbi:hypothetical protein [Hyphobacterium sp.]|uniref:hypothetical protein n=1 Tax=Hyphobacterium sp. TaxID=2004662 RepID=UPI003BAAC1A4
MTASRIFRAILLVSAGLVAAPTEADTADLRGDPEAVEAIQRMMDRFGGDAVWSRARSLYLEYDGWRTEPNEPVIERAWRDLAEPWQRSEYEGRSFHTVYAMTPDVSWLYRYHTGELTPFDAESHAQSRARYPFGFYTILHAFAAGDPRLRLEWQAPDTVIAYNTASSAVSHWRTDSTGALIAWRTVLADGSSFAYLYGPMQNFGLVDFPAWGIAEDGSWRWNYTRVEISSEPPPVSFEPPDGG